MILFNRIFLIHKLIDTLYRCVIIPLFISIFLIYILKPLDNFFKIKGIKKTYSSILTLSIGLTFILAILCFFIRYAFLEFNGLSKSINNLQSNNNVSASDNPINSIISEIYKSININDLSKTFNNMLNNYTQQFQNNLFKSINTIIDVFSKLLLVLVILFFLLRDGDKFKKNFINFFPCKYKDFLDETLTDMDKALNAYVTGQIKVALSLSIMIFIGYKIIGMPSALIWSFFTFVLGFIPFIGFFISMIIPSIIALSKGLFMVLKLILVFITVQTLKGRVVVPIIMSSSLKIHPLTDIFLVITAVTFGGAMAAFVVVPIYAVLKVFLLKMYKFKLITNPICKKIIPK